LKAQSWHVSTEHLDLVLIATRRGRVVLSFKNDYLAIVFQDFFGLTAYNFYPALVPCGLLWRAVFAKV